MEESRTGKEGGLLLPEPWGAVSGRRTAGERWGLPDQEGEEYLHTLTSLMRRALN